MLITFEYLNKFKTSNRIFEGRNISLEATKILNEQKYRVEKEYDIFLSHSFEDAETIYLLYTYLQSLGWSVYVDWIEDSQLDRQNVTRSTAQLLRDRMKRSKTLIYASSSSSKDSKWMPWELGFFDGYKPNKIATLPITYDSNKYKNYVGVEYLSLYPYIEIGTATLWLTDPESHKYLKELNTFINK
jgi:hypothetical protein